MSGRKRGNGYYTPIRHADHLPGGKYTKLTDAEMGALVKLKCLCINTGLLLDGSAPYTAKAIGEKLGRNRFYAQRIIKKLIAKGVLIPVYANGRHGWAIAGFAEEISVCDSNKYGPLTPRERARLKSKRLAEVALELESANSIDETVDALTGEILDHTKGGKLCTVQE